MYSKYDNNMYADLYACLNDGIINSNNKEYFLEDDKVLRLILLNNGCAEVENGNIIFKTTEIIPNYYICFVKNGIANESNEYFDFIEFNGSIYLIVFADYFTSIKIDYDDNDIMGNSIYYNAISNLVMMFMETTSAIKGFSFINKTCAAFNNRYIPIIIAGLIIKNISGKITQTDIENVIAIDELNRLLELPFLYTTSGIRII